MWPALSCKVLGLTEAGGKQLVDGRYESLKAAQGKLKFATSKTLSPNTAVCITRRAR